MNQIKISPSILSCDFSQIGDEIFGGVITIATEAGAEVNINGKVNYIENYLKYSDNLENLFDSIYKINGKITVETTNEERFLISFLK